LILVPTPPFFHCHHDNRYGEKEADRRSVLDESHIRPGLDADLVVSAFIDLQD
jgi:hypothetical protein